jgi:hypothetical protein
MPAPLLPADLARERGVVLHRALRHLPTGLLEPLLFALRRNADRLVPNRLYEQGGDGGCAIGMMLRELQAGEGQAVAAGRLRRWLPKRSVVDQHPELARAHPRLAHIEIVFDNSCAALSSRLPALTERDAARRVGLWMAAEVQAEVNLRHLELRAEAAPLPSLAHRACEREQALLAQAIRRLRELRPWLTESRAAHVIESWLGLRMLDLHPTFVPAEWVEEVRLQRGRLAQPVA